MKVTLLQRPTAPLVLLATAAWTCYSGDRIENLYEFASRDELEELEKIVTSVIDSGHLSVLEHISYTFGVDRTKRSTTHQLVRHRHASYSQQSQRYVRINDILNTIREDLPPHICQSPSLQAKFMKSVRESKKAYDEIYDDLIERGCNREQAGEEAREVLPECTPTNIIVTMNLRELMHISSIRLCSRAQSPIRDLVNEMAKLVIEDFPTMKRYLVPQCATLGYCPEPPKRSCRLFPPRKR